MKLRIGRWAKDGGKKKAFQAAELRLFADVRKSVPQVNGPTFTFDSCVFWLWEREYM